MRNRLIATFTLVLSLILPAQYVAAEEVTPRIAVAYDIGFLGDGAFNDAVHQSLMKSAKRYNLVAPFVREMPTSGTAVDRLTKLRFLAKSGYTLIITVGSGYRETVRRVSMEYPEVQFAPINDKTLAQMNISNIYFDEIDAARIAGTIAAARSKSGVVATIAATPAIFESFTEAAKKVSRKIVTRNLEYNGDIAKLNSDLQSADVVYSLWDKDSKVFQSLMDRPASIWYIARNPDQYFAKLETNNRVIAVIDKKLDKPISQLVGLGLQNRALIDILDEELGIYGRSYGLKNGGIGYRLKANQPKVVRALASLKG